jgi:DNA-binding NarL/FixJ family response regulator
LIVEDEWLQAENLETVLALDGHTICGVAKDGEEAVALACAEHPDIVMMDVQLGGRIDGVEAAERIRRMNPDCRLIFVTGYTDPQTAKRLRDVCPDAILAKPSSERAIAAAIAGAAAAIGCEPGRRRA